MAEDANLAASGSGERQRFMQILRALLALAVVTLVVELAAYAATGEPQLAEAAAINGLFLIVIVLVVVGPLRRDDVASAAAWTSLGLIAVAVGVAVIMPALAHAYIVTPVLAIAIAISFIDRVRLWQLMLVAWLTVAAMSGIAEAEPRTGTVPPWLLSGLRFGGLVITIGVVLGLIAVFADRLRAAASGLAASNERLRLAEVELQIVNDELRHEIAGLEHRGTELALLTDLGSMLDSSESMAELRTVSAAILGPLFEGDSGVLYLVGDEPGSLEAAASWGTPPEFEAVIAPGDCWALRRGRAHVTSEESPEPRCRHVPDVDAVAGVVCVPLNAQAETIGLLHVRVARRGRRGRWAAALEERLRLATVVAEHTALALANLRLRAILRDQSARDHLTGLFNRRYLDESLRRELLRAKRAGTPVGVLLLDLDHFKELNDEYGHAVGDSILAAVGQYLRASVRAEDIPCRYGGEEFLVVLPEASLRDAQRRAEALRRGVGRLQFPEIAAGLQGISVSIGVAAHPPHGPDAEALVQRADAALYRAKTAGRDRVNVASTRPPVPINIEAEPEELSSDVAREAPSS